MKLLLNIFIALAAISAPVCCRADGLKVLWWQVGDETDDSPTGESLKDVMVTRGQSSVSAYDLGVNAARIRETSTDTYLMMLNPEAYAADGMTMLFDMDYMDVPTVWHPEAYAVPEPGSGTLVLVGVALLALRRRRRQHG